MEPVQIGRGDPAGWRAGEPYFHAAMEPVQIGRGDPHLRDPPGRGLGAAMEPVQIGRGDHGAWGSPPGRTAPQWSPSRSDGVTVPAGMVGQDLQVMAAMEPVQIGRGDDGPQEAFPADS